MVRALTFKRSNQLYLFIRLEGCPGEYTPYRYNHETANHRVCVSAYRIDIAHSVRVTHQVSQILREMQSDSLSQAAHPEAAMV